MSMLYRPIDFLVVLLLCYYIFSCVFIERHYCAAPLDPHSENPLMRATYDYAKEWNPLFLARPDWLRVATCFSSYGLLWGYIVLLFGFLWRANAVRIFGLMFVSFKLNAILFYYWMEMVEHGVPSIPMFLAADGPYIVGIVLVLLRLCPAQPFGHTLVDVKEKDT
eukprot:TRINITY_DN12640_c0_g1_i1.p2 TRINITY_DN12640_c0_g1~~TRINITY_DN12640_c0_g1_i1.p2  ORF type:complete len:165 (-),score=54.98 TRINITY_DN12640_c0_g1_i1:278-772(-)